MPLPTLAERCEACTFHRRGECHKSPPVRLPRKFSDKATAGNRVREEEHIWGWPEVQAGEWCGEFKSALAIEPP